jgi:hypothetical protein
LDSFGRNGAFQGVTAEKIKKISVLSQVASGRFELPATIAGMAPPSAYASEGSLRWASNVIGQDHSQNFCFAQENILFADAGAASS